MVTKELRRAACEINQILRYTDDREVNKIPIGLRLFLKEIADSNYIADITPEKSLYSQKLLTETQKILGMIYCFYWSGDEELENISTDVKIAAEKTSQEIFDNYSPEEFFEEVKSRRKNSLEKETEEVKKTPWYKKLFGGLSK